MVKPPPPFPVILPSLIAKKALASLSIDIDSSLMNIVSYFRNTSYYIPKFDDFQYELNMEPAKILVKTRVAMHKVIGRLFDKNIFPRY